MAASGQDPGQGASNTQSASASGLSELQLRIVSAVLLASFALFCTWMGGNTFVLLAVVVALLIFYEFRGLVRSAMPARTGWFSFAFLLVVFGCYIVDRPLSGIAIGCSAALVLALWEWVLRKSVWSGVLLLYSAAPFAAIVALREGESGLFHILFIMACVWGADTLAYFTGKQFGGPKLAPKISPKKTWSGFFGGIAGSVLISGMLLLAFGYELAPGFVIFAVLLSLTSQVGDLFESWVKRRFGVKDSGRLIPGHGGILDRIDGLIFALVAAWLIGAALAGGIGPDFDIPGALESTFFNLKQG